MGIEFAAGIVAAHSAGESFIDVLNISGWLYKPL